MVSGTAVPDTSVAGTLATDSQLSAAVAELTAIDPPPAFSTPTVCDCAPEEAALDLNETKPAVNANCGAGALTSKLTAMLCALPAQGLGAMQVTMTEVELEPSGSASAVWSSARLRLP